MLTFPLLLCNNARTIVRQNLYASVHVYNNEQPYRNSHSNQVYALTEYTLAYIRWLSLTKHRIRQTSTAAHFKLESEESLCATYLTLSISKMSDSLDDLQ